MKQVHPPQNFKFKTNFPYQSEHRLRRMKTLLQCSQRLKPKGQTGIVGNQQSKSLLDGEMYRYKNNKRVTVRLLQVYMKQSGSLCA